MENDFNLESVHHRCSKMWYCHLYAIMMLQHLVAWTVLSESAFRTALNAP